MSDGFAPSPAATEPPGVASGAGSVGNSTRYAREDHTHATSVRRAIVTTGSDGTVTWTFATPYAGPSMPVCDACVEAAASDNTGYEVRIASKTLASVKYFVQKRAIVLGILQLPAPASGVVLHCQAAMPTE